MPNHFFLAVIPSLNLKYIFLHTSLWPPLRTTATAVGGQHPTGMHSCFSNILVMPPSIS